MRRKEVVLGREVVKSSFRVNIIVQRVVFCIVCCMASLSSQVRTSWWMKVIVGFEGSGRRGLFSGRAFAASLA